MVRQALFRIIAIVAGTSPCGSSQWGETALNSKYSMLHEQVGIYQEETAWGTMDGKS